MQSYGETVDTAEVFIPVDETPALNAKFPSNGITV
jgi:hypothetical protein